MLPSCLCPLSSDLCPLEMSSHGHISLRGVEVHNLQGIDLDIPHRKLVVFCGLSGSGKSSLALDTLYAEGQRRYIESFSAYTRQFLQRLEKPEADRIDGIPPAIAVTGKNGNRSSRSTVGTATETADYLRLLYARMGHVFCNRCGREVHRDSPQNIVRSWKPFRPELRFMVAFPWGMRSGEESGSPRPRRCARRDSSGSSPAGHTVHLADGRGSRPAGGAGAFDVVVDRLSSGADSDAGSTIRWKRRSPKAEGRCCILVDASGGDSHRLGGQTIPSTAAVAAARLQLPVGLRRLPTDYPDPEPRLYSFNSPLGACPECEGFGNVIDIDMDLIVPEPGKSIAEGAIAPWNSPAYQHEQQELLALAADYGLPVDVPFRATRAADTWS